MNTYVAVEQEMERWNSVESERQKTKFTSSDRIKCSRLQYKQYRLCFAIKSHDDLSGKSLYEARKGGAEVRWPHSRVKMSVKHYYS